MKASDLTDAIKKARREILDDPRHSFSLVTRCRIWSLLGAADRYGGPGHRCRARLAVLAAAHALPIWQAQWPAITIPAGALELAERIIEDADLQAEGWTYLDHAYGVLDNLGLSEEQRPALTAGRSALVALDTARVDEEHLYTDRSSLHDAEHGGPDEDAAGLAAIAYAGGTRLDPASSPERRLAFWTWYLYEAVPAIATSLNA